MGNIFSRKLSRKDKLLFYDKKISIAEEELSKLRLTTWSFSYFFYWFIFIALILIIVYEMDSNIYVSYPGVILFIISIHYFLSWIKKKRIDRVIKKINDLKKKQTEIINEFKKENDFVTTKKIIEKYEDEESRDSFFKQIQLKKRDTLEKLADYVLDNDPTKLNALICIKCGVHNGLIDPANEKIEYFYCYNCKYKNIRKPSKNTTK